MAASDAQSGAGSEAEFVVRHLASGRLVPVGPDQSMLAALRAAGFEMQSQCEYGVCGWCMVRVVEGVPRHFDSYLTDAEKAANETVMPCVSRSVTPMITLDF